ncbi:MAG TPA: patatin-like phospholipase family protein [Saprospiraceae bacterium]|mgnify:CR=1 FL=1|nr:patatin-like phospholipase family protein [Saprospiraceae bacterium]
MTPLPLKNMAVSLSGGGYRATSFHLGALSYLNYRTFEGISLLQEVKIISTISGGTFTGAMYALRLAQGKTFEDCFNDLYKVLLDDQLVDLALLKLSNPGKWTNTHKSKDMINAFSEVYNESIFGEATFDDLYNGHQSHLTDVIFGSSEFKYGIQFRFQKEHGKGKFGNNYLNLPTEVAGQIRIADAVAASSCFPGGFEPMIMPKDFGNGPESIVDITWNKNYSGEDKSPETAIMDGGVIDNLGIEGVKLAEMRHSKNGAPFVGTYIVSDVSSEMMTPYEVPKLTESAFKNFFTINGINIVTRILLVAIIGVLSFTSLSRLGTIILSSMLPILVIWNSLYFFAKAQLKRVIKETFGQDQLSEYIKDFSILIKTPIYILIYLVQFRLTSVLKMVSDIFLKRIRRLSLNSLYDSPEWNYRFKSNYIYTLDKVKQDLSSEMQKAITSANNMPTTLWFTETEVKNNVLNDLIACGQFTQCKNLLTYLDRIIDGTYREKVWTNLSPDYQQKLLELRQHITDDWARFQKDAYWLLDQHKK